MKLFNKKNDPCMTNDEKNLAVYLIEINFKNGKYPPALFNTVVNRFVERNRLGLDLNTGHTIRNDFTLTLMDI